MRRGLCTIKYNGIIDGKETAKRLRQERKATWVTINRIKRICYPNEQMTWSLKVEVNDCGNCGDTRLAVGRNTRSATFLSELNYLHDSKWKILRLCHQIETSISRE